MTPEKTCAVSLTLRLRGNAACHVTLLLRPPHCLPFCSARLSRGHAVTQERAIIATTLLPRGDACRLHTVTHRYIPLHTVASRYTPLQERAIIATTLSLAASCVCAFIVSLALRGGKFSMVDVQNATLAGEPPPSQCVAVRAACGVRDAPRRRTAPATPPS